MTCSMTAFARCETLTDWGNAVWEIRSVNHRYLEVNFRLPELFSQLEPVLREQLKKYLQRGKVDIVLRYQLSDSAVSQMSINKSLVQQLLQAQQEIIRQTQEAAPLTAHDILRWPGVLQAQEANASHIKDALINLFEKAIKTLLETRQREGAALINFLEDKLAAMESIILKIKQILPQIMPKQREKIIGKLTEAKINYEANRFEQELLFYAQKMDVTEEIDRLATHINETRKTLRQNTAIGRRLDFLLQELNREANTLGAKSMVIETSQASLELKMLIEQMREQAQNIE